MKQALEKSCWSCPTVGGRKSFQVEGDVESGARIRVGASEQLLTFDRPFFQRLLKAFRGREVRIGSKFDDPGPGSLGEWIQTDRGVKMNPAVYVAGLLVRLGYAEYSRRGYIRFHHERVTVSAPEPESSQASRKENEEWTAKLRARLGRLSQDQAEALVELIDRSRPQDDLLGALADNPAFQLPASASQRGRFVPLELKGGPLSEDLIRDRR